MPMLIYIAGCCYYSVCKQLRCETCKTKITSQVGDVRSIENALISRITRGGFLYPLSDVVYFAFYEEANENNHKLVIITKILIWSCSNICALKIKIALRKKSKQRKESCKLYFEVLFDF